MRESASRFTKDWRYEEREKTNPSAFLVGNVLGKQVVSVINNSSKKIHRQFILDKFKLLLEIAAKASEDTALEASIIFDKIGLVLASDYLEAVHKILSMFSTYDKMINANNATCPNNSTSL